MVDQTTPQAETETETPKRFAAYDKTFARFVGGVHDTKAKARDGAKAAGATDVEIREV